MPKGIPKNNINKGWFKKGHKPTNGFTKEMIPWNKNRKGKQKNHNTSGLKPGWNKGLKMAKITGDNNYQWKGEAVSYRALHKWVENKKGSAKNKTCAMCGNGAREWANIDHKYKRVLSHYISLCRKCHIKYDKLTKKYV